MSMPIGGQVPLTHRMAQDQKRAMREGKAMTDSTNHGENQLETQDLGPDPGYVIYVYNLLEKEYIVQQPPLFPGFIIPACKKGNKFSVTTLPAYVNEPFIRPGSTEYYFKRKDGRISATSLLNPSSFPSTNWNNQTADWNTGDQYGNNLNALGCWWSLTRPDEEDDLSVEIDIFRRRVEKTMNEFVRNAESLAAAGKLGDISPWHHFAMDYLGKTAPWHMSVKHMITCPNCGDPVQEGISYHRNAFGEKCIIDRAKYEASIDRPSAPVATQTAPPAEQADPDGDEENVTVGAEAAPRAAGKKKPVRAT